MSPTFSLGRIAGIKIGVNWTWAIVFVLITWSLEAEVFPAQNPGLSHRTYALMGVVAALGFFAALLLHELGHALQARRDGVEIEGITLWLFGGVAQFKGQFPSAGAELRIALAGPAVTLVIGSVCVAIAESVHLPSAVDGVVTWLAYINFLLLVFNMLPALPLDGGRVLRSLLWAAKHDFAAATRAATKVSRLLSFGLIALGIFLFLEYGSLSGVWFALIGWFLLQAAAAEARYPLISDALAGLKVSHLMVSDPVSAEADETLAEFVERVPKAARFTVYPVLEGERVVGALPFSRVMHTPHRRWETERVRDAALGVEEVAVLDPNESAIDAFAALSADSMHRGLVVDSGRLVGLLSLSDFARVLALPVRR